MRLRLRLRSLTHPPLTCRGLSALTCSRYVLIMPADALSSYPYVVVRIACRRCTRKGSYRLARLSAKYGAEIPMMDLLAHLAGDCAIWDTRHPGAPRCGAYFFDLDFPAPPPDRPTEGMRRLRLVKDGGAKRRAAPKKRASASSRTSNGRQTSPPIANPTARSAPKGASAAALASMNLPFASKL